MYHCVSFTNKIIAPRSHHLMPAQRSSNSHLIISSPSHARAALSQFTSHHLDAFSCLGSSLAIHSPHPLMLVQRFRNTHGIAFPVADSSSASKAPQGVVFSFADRLKYIPPHHSHSLPFLGHCCSTGCPSWRQPCCVGRANEL